MPIDEINGERTEKQPQLINQSYKDMPLVIYGLGGVHTHILWWNESDYKKPGVRWPAASMYLV